MSRNRWWVFVLLGVSTAAAGVKAAEQSQQSAPAGPARSVAARVGEEGTCPLHGVPLRSEVVTVEYGLQGGGLRLPLAGFVNGGCVEVSPPERVTVLICPRCRAVTLAGGVELDLDVVRWWLLGGDRFGTDDGAIEVVWAFNRARRLDPGRKELPDLEARLRARLGPRITHLRENCLADVESNLEKASGLLAQLEAIALAPEDLVGCRERVEKRKAEAVAAVEAAMKDGRYDEAMQLLSRLRPAISRLEEANLRARINDAQSQHAGDVFVAKVLNSRSWDAEWDGVAWLLKNGAREVADPALRSRIFFNASVIEVRKGNCAAARGFATMAAEHDDPGSPVPNRRWLAVFERFPDCRDRVFQDVMDAQLALLNHRPK